MRIALGAAALVLAASITAVALMTMQVRSEIRESSSQIRRAADEILAESAALKRRIRAMLSHTYTSAAGDQVTVTTTQREGESEDEHVARHELKLQKAKAKWPPA